MGLPETVPHSRYFSANGLHASSRFRPSSDQSFTRRTGRPASGPNGSIVLTYRSRQRHFGGRPEAVGQTLYFNPRTLHPDWRAATSILLHWSGRFLVPVDLTFHTNFAWGVPGPSQARGVTPRMAEQRRQPLFDQFAKEAPQRFPKGVRPLALRSLAGDTMGGRAFCRPSC